MMQRGGQRSDRVLKEIREALIDRTEVADCEACPCDNGAGESAEDLSVAFAQNFTKAGGTMYYCLNEKDILKRMEEIRQRNGDVIVGCASENLSSFLCHIGMDKCCLCDPSKVYPLGATLCEALIAWNGAIVITSNLGLGKTINALPDTTVVLAFTSQVVKDWEGANDKLKTLYAEYPGQVMVTSPSSYAFRKGMQKLYLILIEDETN